jgi:hypothetical protein
MDTILINLVYMSKDGVMLDQELVQEDDRRLQLISSRRYQYFIKNNRLPGW